MFSRASKKEEKAGSANAVTKISLFALTTGFQLQISVAAYDFCSL